MIDRAMLETRLRTIQDERATQERQLRELQQAAQAMARSCAQLEGAALVIQELLDDGADAPTGAPEKEADHVHRP